MTSIEKWAPLFLWRSRDPEGRPVSQSSERPPMSALCEGGSLTVDFPKGHRMCWRVINGRLVDESELLPPITLQRNPFLESEQQDASRWAIVHDRWKDPLDTLELLAPDEPFVQDMLATRENIRRTYDEITASVPDGLTPRARDEYVAAQVMQSIASGIAAKRRP